MSSLMMVPTALFLANVTFSVPKRLTENVSLPSTLLSPLTPTVIILLPSPGLGMTTNGIDYQFVYMQQGNPPTYQLFPKLDITRSESSVELLQIFKSIGQL
jgi:hypothetical protein